MKPNEKINIPLPEHQIAFAHRLEEIRELYTAQAVGMAVDKVSLSLLNSELGQIAPPSPLKALATKGIRGELVFPVPCLLRANPYLLGYYRLLAGFSQKAFYDPKTGLSRFKALEEKGTLNPFCDSRIEELCIALSVATGHLAEQLIAQITPALLDELVLLTFGPQLRGGQNNRIGEQGIQTAFDLIAEIVEEATTKKDKHKIELTNARGEVCIIEFAPDPDIVIKERFSKGLRNKLAIEVKAGSDVSNIHNRLGEAEKSHQKAKAEGYTQCWTIVNVAKLDLELARQESPTTNEFFNLALIKDRSSEYYSDFAEHLKELLGLPNLP